MNSTFYNFFYITDLTKNRVWKFTLTFNKNFVEATFLLKNWFHGKNFRLKGISRFSTWNDSAQCCVCTVWKTRNSLKCKLFSSNQFRIKFFSKKLISRYFCQIMLAVKSRNFHTVVCAHCGKTRNSLPHKNFYVKSTYSKVL